MKRHKEEEEEERFVVVRGEGEGPTLFLNYEGRRWVSEYPDAGQFTDREARALADKHGRCAVIGAYGSTDQYVGYDVGEK